MLREVQVVGVVVKPPDESFCRLETATYTPHKCASTVDSWSLS
jgi:hypothetical protein